MVNTEDAVGSVIVDEAKADHWAARNKWLVVGALFICALTLRIVDLGGRSVWVDEGASAVLASESAESIIAGDDDFEHPPGYYLLIHYTSQLSDSEAGLRLPSALASSLSVALAFIIGLSLAGPRVALAGAGLLVVAPLDVWFAQEARQPSVVALTLMIALGGLLLDRWYGYAISALALFAGLYVDYITAAGWIAIGGIWAALHWRSRRDRLTGWLGVTVAAAVAYAPVQGAEFASGFRGLLVQEGSGIWYGEILGSNPVTSNPLGLLSLMLVFSFVVTLLFIRLLRSDRFARLWASLIVVGFVLGSIVMPVPRAFSVKKVIVVGWPVLALVIGYLIIEKLSRRSSRAWLVAALGLCAASLAASYFVPKDDWRTATAFVDAKSMNGDVVWVGSESWADNAYVYYGGLLPTFGEEDPSATIPDGGDVWMITYRRPQDDVPSLEAERWFSENWTLVEERPLYRLAVLHYTSP